MKAYKVFNPDWTCRGFQYKVGETYEISEKPVLCGTGFHACSKVSDCFSYYSFDPENKVAEVELIGDIVGEDGDKQATNKIKVVKELSWTEMLSIANTGKGNSGLNNSGDRNSGYRNSGDLNSGDLNSGYRNSGVFSNKKKEDNVFFFNKESEMSWNDWYGHPVYDLVYGLTITEWISWEDMSEEEKSENKNAFVTDGYLKNYSYHEAWSNLWKKFSDEEKNMFKELPNYDPEVFKDITGIDFK